MATTQSKKDKQMSGKYTSPFDDLLASNQKQMDDVLGGSSGSYSPRASATTPTAPTSAMSQNTSEPAGDGTISGTANGIPFSLKV
jgi:hypothetical protein